MLLSVKELQKELNIGRDLSYALVRSNGFPSIKIGNRYYVEQQALVSWLKRYEGKTYEL